jgi:hypothetical protein
MSNKLTVTQRRVKRKAAVAKARHTAAKAKHIQTDTEGNRRAKLAASITARLDKLASAAGAPQVSPPEKPLPRPMNVAVLLRAEESRLEVLKHVMPEKAQALLTSQAWAFGMVAAYLDSLGAPERLERYLPASAVEHKAAVKKDLCASGRTTRMWQEASRLLAQGELVCVVMNSKEGVNAARNYIYRELNANRGLIDSLRTVTAGDSDVDLVNMRVVWLGMRKSVVMLVDHYVIEDRLAPALAMLHRFDAQDKPQQA